MLASRRVMPVPERDARKIRESLAEHDLAALTPRVVDLAEPCLRMRARRRAVRVGGTKIGGHPDLPVNTAWPSCDGRPMTFLAQIDLAEVAAKMPSALPRVGLLSFFFDRTDFHMGQEVCRVVHSTTALERRVTPFDDRLVECELALRLSTSVPEITHWASAHDDLLGLGALSADQRDALLEWRADLDYVLLGDDDHGRHQVLGHPTGAQADVLIQRLVATGANAKDLAAARRHRNLMTIDSDETADLDWADGGCLWYLVERDALVAGDFSHVDSIVELG